MGAGALALESDDSTNGMVLALSGTASIGGSSFTVPGALPPTQADLDGLQYQFQSPDAAYRLGLGSLWTRASEELSRKLAEQESPAQVFLPYAITAQQLGAAAEPFGMEPSQARLQLEHRGCLGVASTLTLVAKYLQSRDEDAEPQVLASLAVGGGVSWCGLAWMA